jgi:hypothetical protein
MTFVPSQGTAISTSSMGIETASPARTCPKINELGVEFDPSLWYDRNETELDAVVPIAIIVQ